jgi:hypothetical protein
MAGRMDFGGPDRPEVRRTGQHTLDMITSVCALMISAVSIYMAWDNGHDMQRLVHANSWPALQLGSGNRHDGTRQMAFTLENAGIGPARLHTFAFFVDGKKARAEFMLAGIAEACCGEEWTRGLGRNGGDYHAVLGDYGSRPIAQTFLSPKEETTVFRWPRTEDNKVIWDAMDDARQTRRISIRVCYCSVFDECWVADSNWFPPREISACPREF